MVTIFSALAEGTKILRDSIFSEPRLEAEVIMSHVIGFSRIKIMTEVNTLLNTEKYEKFIELINLRKMGMPSAYITGHKEFMGIDFIINTDVLIPRGDTEIVVENAIDECKNRRGPVDIVDVGCGSGAIGISIAKYITDAHVTMIDISQGAIEVANTNVIRNNLKDRAKVIIGNLLMPVINERFDLIVSNPPYIQTGEIPNLEKDVKDYEPHIALDGGFDGLEFYKELIPKSVICLKDGGILIFEIGYNEAEPVSKIMSENGFSDIKIIKDLAGMNRCVSGRKQ